MRKKILVTGGCGFIGSNFIRYILDKYPDYQVVNLDKLTYCGRRENLRDVETDPRYKFVKGDICNPKIVGKIAKDCDTIINFAAESHVDRSIVNASEFVRTNIYGTYVLLEAAKEHKITLYCQISTDEVYGSCDKGSFSEDSPLNPSSPYAASKAAADHLVHAYFVTYNLPVIIIRSSNNFGCWQYPEKLIPLFVTNALKDKKVPVYGRGENIRDWIYVLDNCKAIDFIIHNGKVGEIYNVAGNSQVRNIDLTRLILKNMNKSEDLIEFVKNRPGHDLRYALDSTKIDKLGWKPCYNFEQAVKETIEWYRNNRNWWQPLKAISCKL